MNGRNDNPDKGPVLRVKNVVFVAGANDPAGGPSNLPEIAVAGRSNVGKSSFINRILGRKNLARVSATPGKTREFNFYEVELPEGRKLHLVDLPGHGYARRSKAERESWSEKIVKFVNDRKSLRALCLLNDCRREPTADELALRDLAREHGRVFLLVLTKADKLKRGERAQAVVAAARAYGLKPEEVLVSGEGIDPNPFWAQVAELL
jgi:GTP-binding protein